MEILRIPSAYFTQIEFLSKDDADYVLKTIFWLAYWQDIKIEKSLRWWLVLSIWREAIQMENKARAKKWEKRLDEATATLMADTDDTLWSWNSATKSNQNKTKQIKSKQDKTNLSKDKEQSSELVKVDNRDLDIDVIIETMKSFNLWIVDDTIKKQRQYWKLIKDKINKIKWFEKYEWNYNNFITMLYQNSDEYRKNHFRSLEKFYREMANIITWIKIQAEKPIIRKGC